MTIRFIPSLPRGGIITNSDENREVSARNQDAYIIQNNLQFMQAPVTGSDGSIYTWLDTKNLRKGFVNSNGYKRGNPSNDREDKRFEMWDKVGAGGSYILKLGYGTDTNHRWLRGVVGFDFRVRMYPDSTASTNDPYMGKIGMLYQHPISNSEFIYRPTVAIEGPTADSNITHVANGNGAYKRIARKLSFGTDPWLTVHDIDLLFTGIIFEYGHSRNGGAVETEIKLQIKDFKPIFYNQKKWYWIRIIDS